MRNGKSLLNEKPILFLRQKGEEVQSDMLKKHFECITKCSSIDSV